MDPISRGGNCQKVAAHILHPPVDLIMVNNNMVNSIGRVPRPTYRDIFFLTFFPSIKDSSALVFKKNLPKHFAIEVHVCNVF